jgi:hypothetical protein
VIARAIFGDAARCQLPSLDQHAATVLMVRKQLLTLGAANKVLTCWTENVFLISMLQLGRGRADQQFNLFEIKMFVCQAHQTTPY